LVSIDGYILSEEYEKALSTVDKLDSALEGDSFLNMLRANIHYMLIDLDKAIELIEVMMDDYPYSIDAFDTALTLYVEHGKYDKAIEVLNIMNETFELDMDVLKQVVTNGFPEFSKSPQYIKWSK
jgi:tetratricopeptide (TPR) repeat protein